MKIKTLTVLLTLTEKKTYLFTSWMDKFDGWHVRGVCMIEDHLENSVATQNNMIVYSSLFILI